MMWVKIIHKHGHKVVDLNRKKAAREKCLECTGWEPGRVRSCGFKTDCPLWPFRMGAGRQDARARLRAIREYCLWCAAGSKKEVRVCPAKDCALYCYRRGTAERSVEIAPPVPKNIKYSPKTESKPIPGARVHV